MCKSKFQLLYTYLLIAFIALVGVANHYNFTAMSASDSFLTEDLTVAEVGKIDADTTELPEIAKSFATQSQGKSSTRTTARTKTVNLPAVSEIVDDTQIDADGGIKRYHNLLYGHSTSAGGVFKTLYVGDFFTAVIEEDGERQTYRVVARKVYDVDELSPQTIQEYRARQAEYESIYDYEDGITLMTCGNGRNDSSAQRLVLWAVAV